jgi:hypothetical protein
VIFFLADLNQIAVVRAECRMIMSFGWRSNSWSSLLAKNRRMQQNDTSNKQYDTRKRHHSTPSEFETRTIRLQQ